MSLTSTAASVAASTLATLMTLTTDLATATATATPTTSPGRPDHGDHPNHGDQHHPTDSRRGVIIGVISFILPFTSAVVLLRFYTRHYLSGRAVGADDWLMLASLVLVIVDGTTMLLMTTQGLGHHMWTLSDEQITTYNMYFYLSIVFYYACLGTVKTAILLQYLRVFAVKMRKITLVALVLIGLWSSALVLVAVLACRPIQGFWDKSVPASCVPDLPQWYVNAAGNIATDVIIFALPIPVLWHLNLPRSQRLSLIGIFGLGFFTCAISVIRITFLNLNGDDTYSNVAAACWSIGELCCAIVCSCLPTLRPVFFRLLPGPLRHNNRHNYTGDNNNNNNNGNIYESSSNVRQSAFLNAHHTNGLGSGGGGGGFDDTLGGSGGGGGYRLKSVRSGGTLTKGNKPLPSLGNALDAETMIRRGSRAPFASRSTNNSDDKRGASYYNRFYNQFHSAEQQQQQQQPRNVPAPADDTSISKIGLSFTTTSRLRSISSTSDSDSDHDEYNRLRGLRRGRNRNRRGYNNNNNNGVSDSDSDSDLDRYMQWASRDYSRQHYYRHDPEKKAIAAAVEAAATPTTITTTTTPPTQRSLPTTPSRRSLRELVAELASPRGAAGGAFGGSIGGIGSTGGLGIRNSSSTETLGRAARALRISGSSRADASGGNATTGAARKGTSGATFFLSDDEEDSNGNNDNSNPDINTNINNTNNTSSSTKKNTFTGGAIATMSSAPSSVAPTRAHSPSPSLPPTPPRSYSYSHLRRMAAAVGAGVGAAVNAGIGVAGSSGSGIGSGNRNAGQQQEKRDGSSSGSGGGGGGPLAALAAPAISPPAASLIPGDPQAIDRDAYLGLRQGTVTSIEANRPSTAEAEAIGWELPTGPGIQIRREVAQNVGPA